MSSTASIYIKFQKHRQRATVPSASYPYFIDRKCTQFRQQRRGVDVEVRQFNDAKAFTVRLRSGLLYLASSQGWRDSIFLCPAIQLSTMTFCAVCHLATGQLGKSLREAENALLICAIEGFNGMTVVVV